MASNFLGDIEKFFKDILAADSETDFSGTGWILAAMYGEAPLEKTAITLDFVDGSKAAGSSGCNRYSTTYTFDAGERALSFGETAVTMRACVDTVMEQERRFLQALAAVSSFDLQGGSLSLLDATGAAMAEFSYVSQELAGTSWEVTGYNNGKGGVVSVLSGTSITAVFSDDGKVSGSSGCNTYIGPYTTGGEAISIGELASTRKMCFGEGVMEQEAEFLAALPAAATYRISGDRMEMRREDGALVASLQR